jgi:hypothetical protein
MRDVGPGGRSSGTAGLPGSWPSLASVYFLAASAHDWKVSHRPSRSTANTLHAGFDSFDRCGVTQPKDQPTDDLPHPSKPFTMISTSMVGSSKFFGLDELKIRFLHARHEELAPSHPLARGLVPEHSLISLAGVRWPTQRSRSIRCQTLHLSAPRQSLWIGPTTPAWRQPLGWDVDPAPAR